MLVSGRVSVTIHCYSVFFGAIRDPLGSLTQSQTFGLHLLCLPFRINFLKVNLYPKTISIESISILYVYHFWIFFFKVAKQLAQDFATTIFVSKIPNKSRPNSTLFHKTLYTIAIFFVWCSYELDICSYPSLPSHLRSGSVTEVVCPSSFTLMITIVTNWATLEASSWPTRLWWGHDLGVEDKLDVVMGRLGPNRGRRLSLIR